MRRSAGAGGRCRRCRRRFSPLLTSLFVGLLWGFWHLPLHLRGVYDASMGSGIAGFALRIASSCLLAVVFTWLYNRSRGGLLVVVLLHTSVNNTSGYWLPVNIGLTVGPPRHGGALVVLDRMWERPRMPQSRRHPGHRRPPPDRGTFDPGPGLGPPVVWERPPTVDHRGAWGPRQGVTMLDFEDESPVTEMTADECWHLLEHAELGRLALSVRDDVDIFPVNFAVFEGALYFRTSPGSKLAELTANPRVALEADRYDDISAASVIVKGIAERLERQSRDRRWPTSSSCGRGSRR